RASQGWPTKPSINGASPTNVRATSKRRCRIILLGKWICCRASSATARCASTASGRGLQQELTEAIRHIDHDVVAARDLITAPRSIRLHRGKGAIEGRVGVGFGAYVGLARDPVARAGEPNW